MDDIARIDLEYEQRKKNLETFRLESLIKAVEQKFDKKLDCVLGQMQGLGDRMDALEGTVHLNPTRVDQDLNHVEGINQRLTAIEVIQVPTAGVDLQQLQEELNNTKEALIEIRQKQLPEVQQATQELTRTSAQIQKELKQVKRSLTDAHAQQPQKDTKQAQQGLGSVKEQMEDKMEQMKNGLVKVEERMRKSINQDIDRIYQYFCLSSANEDLKKVLKQVEKDFQGQVKQAGQDLIDLGDRMRESIDQVDRSLSDENNQLQQELTQVRRSLEELQNSVLTRSDPRKSNHIVNRDPNHPAAKVLIDENGNAVSSQTQKPHIMLGARSEQTTNEPGKLTLKRSHDVVDVEDEIPSSVPTPDSSNRPRSILKTLPSSQSTETVSSLDERNSGSELTNDGREFTFSGSCLIEDNETITVPGNELPPKLSEAIKALVKLVYTEDLKDVEGEYNECLSS